jgi:delta(3,5)-delta(2,4)-dienoyl-CoA isomerase
MTYKNITIEFSINGEIATVSLNRPQKLNAIDMNTIEELDRVFKHDLVERKPKVVILKGTGRSFTSGLDLTSPDILGIFNSTSKEPGSRAVEIDTIIRKMQSPIFAIATFPRPVICAIDGLCIGLGMDIACACDIRIATETSRFSVREIKIGICADLGSLYFLPRITRNESWVREICLTGRIFDSKEALEVGGFISEIGDLTRAVDIARDISSNDSIAIEGTKINLNKSSREKMSDCFDFVAVWNSIRLQEKSVLAERIRSIMSKLWKYFCGICMQFFSRWLIYLTKQDPYTLQFRVV